MSWKIKIYMPNKFKIWKYYLYVYSIPSLNKEILGIKASFHYKMKYGLLPTTIDYSPRQN